MMLQLCTLNESNTANSIQLKNERDLLGLCL